MHRFLLLFFFLFHLYGQEISSQKMQEVVTYNRGALSLIPTWIDAESLRNSYAHYGLPEIAFRCMDSDMGPEPTYSDLINYLSRFLREKITYLELGVSVGKNLFQVCHYLQNSTVLGWDMENPNKPLETCFAHQQLVDVWPAFSLLDKQPRWMEKYVNFKAAHPENRMLRYDYPPRSNDVYYVRGNVLDESIYERISQLGLKFNLIFSDAFHVSEAVINEYEMIKKYRLLNREEFVIVWDDFDVVGEGARQIYQDLKQRYLEKVLYFTVRVGGWLGMNEKKHTVGVLIKAKDSTRLKQIESELLFLNPRFISKGRISG